MVGKGATFDITNGRDRHICARKIKCFMRIYFLIVFSLLISQAAWAQPANDDCTGALTLSLSDPGSCPGSPISIDNFSGTTVGATPISPYPALTGCDGQPDLDSPAAEVWYTFVSVATTTTFTITGLNTPNVVLYRGGDCQFLTAVGCASAAPGAGILTTTFATGVGISFFLLVSGEDVNDQAPFNLQVTSEIDCSECIGQAEIQYQTPPVNGTFSSGQNIEVCMEVSSWNSTPNDEWLHSVTFEIGAGFDPTSIVQTQVPNGDGNGYWYWEPNTWQSCASGEIFGPGFAYESSAGIDFDANCNTNGSFDDGDPGNNYGDGTNSGDITPDNPYRFCFQIDILDCPPNITGGALNINANLWSDGDSGSWSSDFCVPQDATSYPSLASVVCCDDEDPIVLEFETSCPGNDDGYLELQGGGGLFPALLYDFYIFDDSGSGVPIFACESCSDVVTSDDLAPGNYSITVINVLTGCQRTGSGTIIDSDQPIATAMSDEPCPGDLFSLTGSVSPQDPNAVFNWTGPAGYSSTDQNPTDASEPGIYTLTVSINGCASEPVTTDAQLTDVNVVINASETDVCADEVVVLTAFGGNSYDWVDLGTGQSLGSDNPLAVTITSSPTNIQVTGYGTNNCPDTDEVEIIINPPPALGADIPNNLCADEFFLVQAYGADIYLWADDPAEGPNRGFQLPAGDYQYELQGTDLATGCSSIINVDFTVNAGPNTTITPDNPDLCAGSSVVLTATGGNIFNWVDGPNNSATYEVSPMVTTTYTVTSTDFDGCSGMASVTVYVIDPIETPQVSCGTITPNSVVFTWPAVTGATNYVVNVSTGQAGVLDTTGDPVTYTVTGLSPNEAVTITVSTVGGGMCGEATSNAVTCQAENCPPVTVTISSPVTGICLDGTEAPVDLDVTISNGGGAGSVVWSGTGITDTTNGIFDPSVAGVGNHVITATYTEGACPYLDMFTINVTNAPTATFSIDDTAICRTESATISYTGSAASNATYVWDFDGGTAVPGNGQGPHVVTWMTAGTKTITLTVTENGCDASYSSTLTLDEPLTAPIVNCGVPTTTSISINWLDVVGASNYSVNVLTGQTGVMVGNVFTVEDLDPEEVVMMEVIAESENNCPSTSTPITCVAASCPVFGLTLSSSENDICLEPDAALVNLNVEVTGGLGDGSVEWSGIGVVDTENGLFNPIIAGAGDHAITMTYTEGPCSQSSTIIMTVFDKPSAAFSLAPDNVCIDDLVTTTYTGGNDINTATFNWTFGGGVADPGMGGEPQEISWPTAGDQMVTLVVEENGCVSDPVMQSVTVEAPLNSPVLNCSSSVDEIIFTWAAIDGAIDYQVNVVSGQVGVQGPLSFTVSNLSLLESVDIEVIAIGDGACGNSAPAELECIAEDCPDVVITVTDPMPICLDGTTTPFPLDAVITGGLGNGTRVWTGDGVNEVDETFDPVVAGPGTHTVNLLYQEGNCPYNASMVIEVYALPEASFTMPDSICVEGVASILFSGNAGANATYTWDFGDATVISGTNEGPYEVSWATAGVQTIGLIVTENGCPSVPFSGSILVENPIADPVITCETTETSITFSWEDVPGAYDYNVIGSAGVRNGNTYAITDLAPGSSVSITVEALTNNSCGSVSATQECFASNCEELTVSLLGPNALCQGETANVILNFSDGVGPFAVDYMLNGNPGSITLPSSGDPIVLENLMSDVNFEVVSFSDLSNPLCTFSSTAEWQISVHEELSAGMALDPVNFCQGEGELVNLIDLVDGSDAGGVWMQVPGQTATGFDATNGTFNPNNLSAGTYSFIYQIDNTEPCVDHDVTVSVLVDPIPNADAGEDQSLFCNLGMVTIGSSNSDEGNYLWTVDNPEIIITDSTSLMIEVSQAGTYTLEVTNEFGCVAEDMMTLQVQDDVPTGDFTLTDISCFGDDNGSIVLTNVSGGTPPYEYSLNGGPFVSTSVFTSLSPGVYSVSIKDANTCYSELQFDVTQPEELIVRLLPQIENESEPYVIESGDSIRLDVQIPGSTVVDTILWSPKEYAPIDNNSLSISVSPDETTAFSVTVIDEHGCSDTDEVMIFVAKNRNVYIPSAFSPNGDGVNDVLYIQSGSNVVKIHNFMVFNRWGEAVFELADFLPNDRNLGWDGKFRGKPMNTAVFVYEAEVEFQDGKIEIISGETMLLK